MRGLFRLALALSFAAPLYGLAAHAQSLPSKIDQYMGERVKLDHFMGSILVARDGEIVVTRGYGMADLKRRLPNTPHTEFRIGSLTKQFTATAILQLQARGKLNVEEAICKFIPDCPKDWRPITIHDLLTHTSGIPNFTSFPSYRRVESQPTTPTELLALFENEPLDFEPGARFSYSNSGYEVLGYIIERVSGQTYRRFLEKNIFGPLGMKESGYDSSHPTGKSHAVGYACSNGGYRPARYVDMTVPYSAGALYSTVLDLYTWDRALAAGKLLPKPLRNQMFARQVSMGGSGKLHYGFGWIISREFGYERYWHEGGIEGFSSINSWFPDRRTFVIVLDNVSLPKVEGIAHALDAIVFGKR